MTTANIETLWKTTEREDNHGIGQDAAGNLYSVDFEIDCAELIEPSLFRFTTPSEVYSAYVSEGCPEWLACMIVARIS